MANRKISELTILPAAQVTVGSDYLPIIDAGELDVDKNKRITVEALGESIETALLAGTANAAASAAAAAASEAAAAASAAAAAASAAAAAASAAAADSSEADAETAQALAEAARDAAITARNAAQAAQAAAELAEANAETAETNAETAATNAATSATNAATSATNSSNSAAASAASAAAAAASADAVLWQDVVFISTADSPYTVTSSHRGVLIAVDATGGAVTINLPSIAGLSLTDPFALGIKKIDSGSNAITVNRNGTDTIDGAASKTINTAEQGAVLVPDTTTAPDRWTAMDFGPPVDGTVTAAKLASDSVTTVKIADSNVTTAKIANANVTTDKIADLNVTTGKIADLGVTTGKINDLAVTTGKINDLAVTDAKLAADSVITSKIANLNVTTGKINDLAVTDAKLAADSVITSKILDANVTTAKIANLAVTDAKLAADSVITSKILDANVTEAKIANLAVTTGKINDLAVTTAKINDLGVTTGKINDLAVTTGKINDLAVTDAKLAADSVITSKILDANVTTAKIANLAVTDAKLAADSVITSKILDANVTTAKIANLAVTDAKLAADSVITSKILDSNVTTAKINDLAVTTGKINDLAVTSAKLATDAVTTGKITDLNVTSAKLAADSVVTAKILDANVTEAKLANNAVTTSKIADGAVTASKLSGAVAGTGAKNAIINGAMHVWERGATISPIQVYNADRWYWDASGTQVLDFVQSTDVPSFADAGRLFLYSAKLDVTTADAAVAASDYGMIGQRIEGFNFQPFAQRAICLSFWIKSNKTGTYCIAIRNGGYDRAFVKEYTINAANTWEKKTLALTATPSAGTWYYDNEIGLDVSWILNAGTDYHTTADSWNSTSDFATSNQVNFFDSTSNELFLTGVQLELGTSATEFEAVPFQDDLARCMRYYERSGAAAYDIFSGNVTSGSTYYRGVQFRVRKRTVPNITYTDVGNSGFASGNPTTGSSDTYGFYAHKSANSNTNGGYYHFRWEVDAEL